MEKKKKASLESERSPKNRNPQKWEWESWWVFIPPLPVRRNSPMNLAGKHRDKWKPTPCAHLLTLSLSVLNCLNNKSLLHRTGNSMEIKPKWPQWASEFSRYKLEFLPINGKRVCLSNIKFPLYTAMDSDLRTHLTQKRCFVNFPLWRRSQMERNSRGQCCAAPLPLPLCE